MKWNHICYKTVRYDNVNTEFCRERCAKIIETGGGVSNGMIAWHRVNLVGLGLVMGGVACCWVLGEAYLLKREVSHTWPWRPVSAKFKTENAKPPKVHSFSMNS